MQQTAKSAPARRTTRARSGRLVDGLAIFGVPRYERPPYRDATRTAGWAGWKDAGRAYRLVEPGRVIVRFALLPGRPLRRFASNE